jgi:2,3-bisphosphoglycerate-independent phosphoglycerate mutase
MDHDSRWERVQKAYDCMRLGKGIKVRSAAEAIAKSYERSITDEFIEPTCIVSEENMPIATVDDGDGVVFFNFRGTTTRITRAFVEPDFKDFLQTKPNIYYV